MLGALDVHRVLLEKEIAHEIIRLPRAVLDAAEVPGLLAVPASNCVAVSVFACGPFAGGAAPAVPGQLYPPLIVLLLAVGAAPDVDALGRAARVRVVRLATPAQINAATDYAAGQVCPANLPPSLPVLADVALTDEAVLYCPTGESGTVLRITSHELLLHSRAWIGAFARPALRDIAAYDEPPLLVGQAHS